MMKLRRNLVCAGLVLSVLCACTPAPSSKTAQIESKIYEISGKHSAFGPYTGEVEVRKYAVDSADPHSVPVDVIRVVNYSRLRFEDKKIREVWTSDGQLTDKQLDLPGSASGSPASGKLVANFNLKKADFLNRVDRDLRTRHQFHSPALVSYSVALGTPPSAATAGSPWERRQPAGFENPSRSKSLKAGEPPALPGGHSTILAPTGSYEEDIVSVRDGNVAEPIWKDERQALPSKGEKMQLINQLGMLTLFLPVVTIVRQSAFYKHYADRPEVKSETQYFVLDPTDLKFFRAHPDTLSVNNKVLDKISLVESTLRHSAYGHSLEEKAESFQNDMEARHINEYGLFSGAQMDANGKFVGYTCNGDGALWSGMYAGSQAMRWMATKDPQALANFKKTTTGLMLLMDVTGDPKEFARTAHPMIPGETLSGVWQQGVPPYQNIKYVKGGNNDMIKGLFHAFSWAYEILSPDDPFLQKVSEHARRLPRLRIAHEKVHPGNMFCSTGLAALASGEYNDLAAFLAVYELVMQPIGLLHLDEGFYSGGIGDWSGVNLIMVSQVSEILIAKNLATKFKSKAPVLGPVLDELVGHLRQKLMETWATYVDARRDFMTIAADTFCRGNSPLLKFPDGTTPTNWGKKEHWQRVRGQSIYGLLEMPMPIDNHVVAFDYTLKPDWCVSAWPHLPWKSLVEMKELRFYFQGAYNYPQFEGPALNTDNVWTSAFNMGGRSTPSYRNGRIDYLHVYWMARLSGLINKDS